MGKIGEKGFKILINNKKLQNIPFIMETPVDETRNDVDNIVYVKELLNNNHC